MKKALRIIGIVFVVLIVLVFAACFFAPKFARGYIEDHSKELVGRKVQIGDISFNPLRFTFTVDDFILFEKDDSTKFVAFHQFFVNADPSCLLVGDICLSEVKIDSPYARVIKNGSVFNFTDILAKFAPTDSIKSDSAVALADTKKFVVDSTVSPTDALPFGISIKRISILTGDILFDDMEVDSHIEIKDFSVKVPEVYFLNKNTNAGVNFEFASGGSLDVVADYNMQKGDFALNVKLSKFAIGAVKPYLESSLNLKDLSGDVSVDLSVNGNVNDVFASSVKCIVSVDDVVLTEASGKTIGVSHVAVGIAEANLNENRFVVDSVLVRGAYAHFDLYKNSNNIEVLLTPKSKSTKTEGAAVDSSIMALPDSVTVPVDTSITTAESSKPIDALLKELSISDTKFMFNDNTIPDGFTYTVSGISVDASNIAYNKTASVRIRASLPHGGSAKVTAKILPADPTSLQANIDVKNMNLQDFSKYSEYYTGYPLVAGSFGLASDNVIKNYVIDSKHNIDIYNLTVGDKPSSAKPEYMVPMKVALYILKDKDNKIAFDIPVTGNLKEPEFSYGKIIWQTVMNLLIKVALSPANLLLGGSTPSDFAFDITADDFTSEQYGIAKEWTKVLTAKPGAKLTVLQAYNPKRQLDAFVLGMQKIEFYKAQNGKQNLTAVERKTALEASEDDAFKGFVKSWERPFDDVLLALLNALAEERNQKMLKALQGQSGVTVENLKVRTAKASECGAVGKKSVFRMSVELP